MRAAKMALAAALRPSTKAHNGKPLGTAQTTHRITSRCKRSACTQ